ncbi:MAG: low temperature requirement protein A [Saprospiraceae bacterium]|nr:low temperature requirement protein A [Saprospiraceae bacterium]
MTHQNNSSIRFLAGDDQPVSFAELFFELVFVFCVTQVVHLLEYSFDLVHIGRAILFFWLIWWAWTHSSPA